MMRWWLPVCYRHLKQEAIVIMYRILPVNSMYHRGVAKTTGGNLQNNLVPVVFYVHKFRGTHPPTVW